MTPRPPLEAAPVHIRMRSLDWQRRVNFCGWLFESTFKTLYPGGYTEYLDRCARRAHGIASFAEPEETEVAVAVMGTVEIDGKQYNACFFDLVVYQKNEYLESPLRNIWYGHAKVELPNASGAMVGTRARRVICGGYAIHEMVVESVLPITSLYTRTVTLSWVSGPMTVNDGAPSNPPISHHEFIRYAEHLMLQ